MAHEQVLVAVVAAIPASIAAGAAWRSARHSKEAVSQTATTNGKKLGELVERVDRNVSVLQEAFLSHAADQTSHYREVADRRKEVTDGAD